MLPIQQHTQQVKRIAKKLGFDYCGIAKAVKLEEDARKLEKWLHQGMHGKMHYMENHFDLRVDPTKLVPGAKSVITVLKNYYPSAKQEPNTPKIAKYAWGKDYHEVIRAQLKIFLSELSKKIGAINGRGFVDSAPVLERAWAVQSGLGWVGKNGNLIHKQSGSFFFIATLIVDLALEADSVFAKDYCGTCTKCIDACPTEAILPDKQIDGSKCISYYTIELKDALLPDHLKDAFNNWMFGCDICQDICPWNRFSKQHDEPLFEPIPAVLNLTTSQWEELSEESFKTIFKDSPLKRTKFSGIKRNLRLIQSL